MTGCKVLKAITRQMNSLNIIADIAHSPSHLSSMFSCIALITFQLTLSVLFRRNFSNQFASRLIVALCSMINFHLVILISWEKMGKNFESGNRWKLSLKLLRFALFLPFYIIAAEQIGSFQLLHHILLLRISSAWIPGKLYNALRHFKFAKAFYESSSACGAGKSRNCHKLCNA